MSACHCVGTATFARKGFCGYPVATFAFYGPTDKEATKLVVGIVATEGAKAESMRKWFSEADLRKNPSVREEALDKALGPRRHLHSRAPASRNHATMNHEARVESMELTYSKHCQAVSRDDKTVKVEIYSSGEDGWILEVVDEYGNSTVWDQPFAADDEAIEEFQRTLREEGIDSMIGQPE